MLLGLLLFSLHINDLPSVCDDVESLIYTDDALMGEMSNLWLLSCLKLWKKFESGLDFHDLYGVL